MFVQSVGCLVGENGSQITLEISGDQLLFLIKTQTSVFLLQPQTFEPLYRTLMYHQEARFQEEADSFSVTRVLDQIIFTFPNHDQAIFSASELAPVLAFLINAQVDNLFFPMSTPRHERRYTDLDLL